MSTPFKIFCCYAPEDQEMLNHLKTHLTPLLRQGDLTIWSDTDLKAGEEREKELQQHLESADIILLLISSNFMASDYCYNMGMSRAIARNDQGSARVIPILLRPTFWQNAPFAKLYMVPTDAKPVTDWSNHDNAFHDITMHINQVVSELQIKRAQGKIDDTDNGEQQRVVHQAEPFSEIKHKIDPEPTHRSNFLRTGTSFPHVTRRKILVVGVVGLGIIATAGARVLSIFQGSSVGKNKGSSATVIPVSTHAANNPLATYLKGGTSDLTSVTWSRDGTLIALGVNNRVRVLNAMNGNKVFETEPQPSPIFLVAWSPDGSKIASGCLIPDNQQGRVQVWNAHDYSQIARVGDSASLPWSFSWSPDGQKLIISADDSILDLWDAASRSFNADYEEAASGSPVAWSPNGNAIASSGLTTIDIWKPDTAALFAQYPCRHQSYALAWSPDGSYLAASSMTTIEIWDTQKQRLLTQIDSGSQTDPVTSIVWSPKNEEIATASLKQNGVQIWKLANKKMLQPERSFPGATSVAWSPDGSKIALVHDGALEIWLSP